MRSLNKNILFVCVLLRLVKLEAQDTICFTNGKKILAKVNRVVEGRVYYQLFNSDAPDYVESRYNVQYIHYGLGALSWMSTRTRQEPWYQPVEEFQKIKLEERRLIYNDHRLSCRELENLVERYPFATTKSQLMMEMKKARHLKNKGHLARGLIVSGFVVPLIASYIFTAAAFDETIHNGTPYWVVLGSGITIGAACRISGYWMESKSRHQLKAQSVRVAEIYNELK